MSDQKTIKTKIGSVSMPTNEIVDNLVALVKAVAEEAKKLGAQPIKKITLSPTMGKGVKVDYSGIL